MDYFSVLPENFPIGAGTTDLTEPFCVQGGRNFEFKMQLTALNEVEDMYLQLLKDDVVVAQSGMDDSQEPSSLSLLYNEFVTDEDGGSYMVRL